MSRQPYGAVVKCNWRLIYLHIGYYALMGALVYGHGYICDLHGIYSAGLRLNGSDCGEFHVIFAQFSYNTINVTNIKTLCIQR